MGDDDSLRGFFPRSLCLIILDYAKFTDLEKLEWLLDQQGQLCVPLQDNLQIRISRKDSVNLEVEWGFARGSCINHGPCTIDQLISAQFLTQSVFHDSACDFCSSYKKSMRAILDQCVVKNRQK